MITSVRKKAKELLVLAKELESEGKIDDTIKVYEHIIEIDPTWVVAPYNLGFIYKYKCHWELSLHYNLMALHNAPSDQPSIWNAGIAATALSKWLDARAAWKRFGINLPDDPQDAELRMNIGTTPIRLKENGEVIWAKRIDPARAIIENIPTAESNRRYGDIVLNDGAPNGFRKRFGQDCPVFDELELWQASDFQTYSILVSVKKKKAIEHLEKMCDDQDFGFENWTDNIGTICRQCSEGTPHEKHDRELVREYSKGNTS